MNNQISEIIQLLCVILIDKSITYFERLFMCVDLMCLLLQNNIFSIKTAQKYIII